MAIQYKNKNKRNNNYKVSFTEWVNNTNQTMKFDLLSNVGPNHVGEMLRVTLKPGETITLESEYDQGIRTTRIENKGDEDEREVIVGGIAPRLTKVGSAEIELHPSLDYEAMSAKSEMEDAMKSALLTGAVQRFAEANSDKISEVINQKKVGRPAKQQ